jgi:molybdopterin synthase sulfur carrier subunit
MGDVSISLSSSLAQFTGGVRRFSVPAGTVRQVLEKMQDEYPRLTGRIVDDSLQPLPFVRVYVGDDDVRDLGSADSAVAPGTTVMVLAAVAGG